MTAQSPFGRTTRIRVLEQYFANAGTITETNAWEHVYRCLLWINLGTGLAHIYDSNHMQPGGSFHSRAVRFTELLCAEFGIARRDLPDHIDYLFRGCVAEWRRTRAEQIDSELENELIVGIEQLIKTENVSADRAAKLAREIELISRDFFTIGNKRKNALGEGFEDLILLLLERVSKIPSEQLALRTPISELPGFRRAVPRRKGARTERQPRPDLAIVEKGTTHVITTAKWSMRQDRETQFHAEYTSYQLNKTQTAELRFALITNEFDVARLNNVARAMPNGAGGYIFHNVYHINPDLLVRAQGDRIGDVKHWIGVGKIGSLADFLTEMRDRYGKE